MPRLDNPLNDNAPPVTKQDLAEAIEQVRETASAYEANRDVTVIAAAHTVIQELRAEINSGLKALGTLLLVVAVVSVANLGLLAFALYEFGRHCASVWCSR